MSGLAAVLLAAVAGWVLAAPNPAARRLASPSTRADDRPRQRPALLERLRRRPAVDRRRAALHELLATMAAELRTGAAPREVLSGAAVHPELAGVAAAARQPAGQPARALMALASQPGAEAAADLAAVWRVSEATGCSLVGPVERLVAARRAQDRTRRELAAQLAGPRATARLLALLPVGGLALGHALGADPVAFLVGTPVGRACLVAGVVLASAGLLWTRAIVTSVLGSAGAGP